MEGHNAAAVWARVRGQGEAASLAETLPMMISDELTERGTYLRLQRCAPVFRMLAREEGCHARRLTALYFLLTGQEVCAETGALPHYASFAEALRDRFAQELQSAKRYRTAAERWPEHGSLFRALAAQEQAHADRLHRLTQTIL